MFQEPAARAYEAMQVYLSVHSVRSPATARKLAVRETLKDVGGVIVWPEVRLWHDIQKAGDSCQSCLVSPGFGPIHRNPTGEKKEGGGMKVQS